MVRSRLRARAPEAAAAAFGVVWLVLLGGGRALAPWNLDWLGYGDRASQLVGWLLFRNEPWRLPLGRIDGLLHPLGTTIAVVDGIPLVALTARLLSPILPADFQYLGPWMGLCFALQGWFGARLVARWSERPEHRVLGGGLFVLAPPLAARAVDPRMLHASLCGQWIVLAALALALAPAADPRAARRSATWMAALSAVAVFVHPALAAMASGLALALLARFALERALSPASLAASLAVIVGALGASLLSLGYAGGAPLETGGFGEFSADLLSLFNPMWLSKFVPALPMGPRQYEGFGYLGLGIFGLGAVAAVLVARRSIRSRGHATTWGPLVAVTFAMAAFALSSRITFAGRPVLQLDAVYAPIAPLAQVFRSSGRFVWPLHYLLGAGALAVVLRCWAHRPRLATAALAATFTLQLVELSAAPRPASFAEEPWRPTSPAWQLAAGKYRHLALVPPEIHRAGGPCYGPYEWDYYVPVAYEAYRLGTTFNSGWVPRLDVERAIRACDAFMAELERGRMSPDTLYVVHPQLVPELRLRGAVCGAIDRLAVCVAGDRDDPLRSFLEAQSR